MLCFLLLATDWFLVELCVTMANTQPSPGAPFRTTKRHLADRLCTGISEHTSLITMTKRAKTQSLPLTLLALQVKGAQAEASTSSKSPTKPHSREKENDQLSNVALTSSLTKTEMLTSTEAAARVTSSKKENDADDSFPMPAALPMMRYTSSAFSDISMPIPDLTSSKSFGPSGFLLGPPILHPAAYREKQLVGVASFFGSPMPEDYPVPYASGGSFQRDATNVTSGDLTLAACALLDLTPAVVQKHRSTPPETQHQPHRMRLLERPRPNRGTDASEDDDGLAEAHSQVQFINARVALCAQRLLSRVPLTLVACKCKNSMCLKLYCTCFQTGTFCDELICKCKGCNNTAEHTVPRGSRTRAIYEILHRRVDAFEPRLKKKTGRGCSCRKSR